MRLREVRALLVAAALAGATAGCSGAAETEPTRAEALEARVDPVAEAFEAVDYLPWDYAPDGCFARSYYVAMELAVRGVPAAQEILNLRWTQSPGHAPRFAPVDGRVVPPAPISFGAETVTWDYHVAALVLPPAVDEPTVLDRAMEPGPVPLATWMAHANAGGQPESQIDAAGVPSPGFNAFATYGSTYVGLGPSLALNWASLPAQALSTPPAFRAADVALACDTVWTVFDCLGNANDPRRARLVARTNALLAELASAGRLTGWSGSTFACGRTAFTCASRADSSS